LNLAKTAYDKIKAGTPIEKDMLARKMLLNLSINEMAPSFIWKEPFASVFNDPSYSFGAAEDSLLEPFDSISDWLLSSPDIDWVLRLREASRAKFVQQYQL
jgi:hypothetical protein